MCGYEYYLSLYDGETAALGYEPLRPIGCGLGYEPLRRSLGYEPLSTTPHKVEFLPNSRSLTFRGTIYYGRRAICLNTPLQPVAVRYMRYNCCILFYLCCMYIVITCSTI
jgi:hypothetical protein